MSNAARRRPQRVGAAALLAAALAVLPATVAAGGASIGPSPNPERPPTPVASTCDRVPPSDLVGLITAAPAPTSEADACLGRAVAVHPEARTDAASLRPPDLGEQLAQGVHTGSVGCAELDWYEQRAILATAQAMTLRAALACPPVPPVVDTVTYQVVATGRPQADVGEFRRLAGLALDDARGWRQAGLAFVEVPEGGRFTLHLSDPASMAGVEGCSDEWSCNAGNDVHVNDLRWRQASPAWLAAGASLADYRRMVVNHEVGHWLGFDHFDCEAPGNAAPVMQQQSKDLLGCRPSPWPRPDEIAALIS